MSTKLVGLETWLLQDVKPYWINEINETLFSEANKDEMKVELNAQIASLSSLFGSYSINETAWRDILQPLFTYIMVKYELIYPSKSPAVSDLLDNDDLRSLFQLWTYDLPSTVESMFIIQEIEEEGVPTGEGEIIPGADYTLITSVLNNQLSTDTDEMYNFRNAVTGGIVNTITYQMWEYPPVAPTRRGLIPRDFALVDMNMQEILDRFNITVVGING